MERTIRFHIEYFTRPGEHVVILGSTFHMGDWIRPQYMSWKGAGQWETHFTFKVVPDRIEYKYGIVVDNALSWEAGKNRVLLPKTCVAGFIECIDSWKAETSPEEGYLYSSLFQDIFGRPSMPQSLVPLRSSSHSCVVKFVIRTANVVPEQDVFVCGSAIELGAWRQDQAKPLYFSKPDFVGEFVLPLSAFPIEFKFLVKNRDGTIAEWEHGDNRIIKGSNANTTIYTSIFKRNNYNWRGAGVAVPVFSLRSNNGMGVGEFYDIRLVVDLCNRSGLKLIQLLPINDTSCYGTWRDSYPYSGLSVFALHPLYLHIPAITNQPHIIAVAQREAKRLNALPQIDYEEVMSIKLRLIEEAFIADGGNVLMTPEFAAFMDDNKSWILSYAVFKVLSEQFRTTDFSQWPEDFKRLSNDQIEFYSQKFKDRCDIIYFTQYFLHVQLSEVAQYARDNHVGIKGDLPIGVNLRSVDSWCNPHLFNLNMSTGAPPDQFSVDGQNWGFPTYNWEEMKKDGYKWWRSRLHQMSKYFQAFRIDHILGFFRIWEIPRTYNSGLMGHFYPSIPVHRNELETRNVWDIERISTPYIPEDAIRGAFGDKAQFVMDMYLDRKSNGDFAFKSQYDTETKIIDYCTSLKGAKPNDIDPGFLKDIFCYFIKNVCFIPQAENPHWHFYPRINMNKTMSFERLDQDTKNKLWDLYIDYYYRRQENLWKSIGEERLPMIKSASDMLVCGEDLGMLPDCIFPVMKKLSILGLRVQRMPPDPKKSFAHPSDYEYMSVCTTSSHDCSTIRGWWEEDPGKTQLFFNQILGEFGVAPAYCEPWIVKKIIEQHMWSPSMWAIFPIQDFFGIIDDLRVSDPRSEQINEPSNPQHYWRYRIHVTLEDLIGHRRFSDEIKNLIVVSGRQ